MCPNNHAQTANKAVKMGLKKEKKSTYIKHKSYRTDQTSWRTETKVGDINHAISPSHSLP